MIPPYDGTINLNTNHVFFFFPPFVVLLISVCLLVLPPCDLNPSTWPKKKEQLKFVYDTLEEFVVCGYTYFPVKDLTANLKLKSQRKSGAKHNQYEKEYTVRQSPSDF